MSLAKCMFVCACALTLLFAPAALVQAQGPFGLGPNDPIVDPPHIQIFPDNNQWHTPDPVPFYFDPKGGWIEKWLEPPTSGWEPGVTYTLHEEFEFFPPPTTGSRYALTDWHEHFSQGPSGAPPFGKWLGGTISTDWPLPGGPDPEPVPGLRMEMDDARIWFFFDAIHPGNPNDPTVLHIWKEFEFVGGPNDVFLPILVHEYPTIPEPGTFALAFLGAGMVGIVTLRRRWG